MLEDISVGAVEVNAGFQLSKGEKGLLIAILRVGKEEVSLLAVDLLPPATFLLGATLPPIDFQPDAIGLAPLGVSCHLISVGRGRFAVMRSAVSPVPVSPFVAFGRQR